MSAGLSLTEVKACLKKEAARVEDWLRLCLRVRSLPEGLREAMEYSLLAGGKRIRPVLCLVSARMFACDAGQGVAGDARGCGADEVMPFAAAIECIHTYSLIHDDLPAMDDDDLRRGKPTSHKRFGEATAILAGDGLLTDAFDFMASMPGLPPERVLRALGEVARAAGSSGMVGGQFLDMQYTAGEGVSVEELAAMHAMKTGALLIAPCVAGAILGGADERGVAAMRAYGAALGAAFQIADDILDETGDPATLGKAVGRDVALRKTTYPSLLGLEKSRELARKRVEEAVAALQEFTGEEADLLRGLAEYMANRVS